MKSISITVEGREETVAKIGLFDMELRRDLIKLVQSTNRAVGRSARGGAPVSNTPKSRGKNGDLKASIRAKTFDKGLSSTVVPRRPRGAHRHLVEYGTKSRRTRSGANRGRMPANPFMNRAQKSNEDKYNQNVRGIVERDKTI